jgi:hypothetical protein
VEDEASGAEPRKEIYGRHFTWKMKNCGEIDIRNPLFESKALALEAELILINQLLGALADLKSVAASVIVGCHHNVMDFTIQRKNVHVLVSSHGNCRPESSGDEHQLTAFLS